MLPKVISALRVLDPREYLAYRAELKADCAIEFHEWARPLADLTHEHLEILEEGWRARWARNNTHRQTIKRWLHGALTALRGELPAAPAHA